MKDQVLKLFLDGLANGRDPAMSIAEICEALMPAKQAYHPYPSLREAFVPAPAARSTVARAVAKLEEAQILRSVATMYLRGNHYQLSRSYLIGLINKKGEANVA